MHSTSAQPGWVRRIRVGSVAATMATAAAGVTRESRTHASVNIALARTTTTSTSTARSRAARRSTGER